MTNITTHQFMNRNQKINTKAAMQAGHDARTEGLRILTRRFIIFLTSNLQKNISKKPLMVSAYETRDPS